MIDTTEKNMVSEQKKSKLIWHCRRGMLELDLILNRFMTRDFNNLTNDEVDVFERLLTYPDPDLYAWFMGYDQPVDKELVDVIAYIRFHNHV